MKKKFLILGAEGQLGTEFVRLLSLKGIEFSAPAEKQSSITDSVLMRNLIHGVSPEVVINCAAYNLVDRAENEKDTALRVNSEAPGNLRRICLDAGAFFVHYSSDYVFDGTKGDLYTEEDDANPLNVYGQSKLEGEKNIAEVSEGNSLVFRTSWVIGRGAQNFLFKLSKWTGSNQVLKISADEVSVPTFTHTIVHVTLKALEKGITGLYHLTSSGYASRYELARYFVSKKNLSNILVPVPVSSFETAAKRPLFAAMQNSKLSGILGITIPHWQESMDEWMEEALKVAR